MYLLSPKPVSSFNRHQQALPRLSINRISSSNMSQVSSDSLAGSDLSSSDADMKTSLLNAIDEDRDALLEFLNDFNTAASSEPDRGNTVPAANSIIKYLSQRSIRTVTIAPEPARPSVVSIFDEGEGPCLVLNGLISTSYPEVPVKGDDIPPCTAGTAAIVAAYAYLHARRRHLFGTVVLEALSDDDDTGANGACYHLLHKDERRGLWRGDCMLNSGTGGSGMNASLATHPMAVALSNNGRMVLGRRPSIPVIRQRDHCALWRDLGVPSFSYGVGRDSEEGLVRPDEFIGLVKVLTLTAWDYVRLGE